MRMWHRWVSVLFGVFLLWIAATGLASQVVPLLAAAGEASQARAAEPPPPGATPAGFVCPETMNCRPRPAEGSLRAWVGTLHHLHSGESFGPAGTAISLLSGVALLFFAFSGLWMYLQMWRTRRTRAARPEWFWR